MKTKEEFLSKKLTARLNMAISPFQRYKLEKIVSSINRNNNRKQRKVNLSEFIREILDFIINNYENGKNLKEIQGIINTADIKELIRKNSHIQITLTQEDNIKLNRYLPFSKELYSLLMRYADFILGGGRLDDDKLIGFFKNMNKFMLSNNLTKEFKIDIFGKEYIITYAGTHENIHFEQMKGIIALAGILGFELSSFLYSPRYVKLMMRRTSLMDDHSISLENRRALIDKNLEKILNLHYIVNDLKTHLWIRMSQINDSIISFKDFEKGKKIINNILKELSIYSKEKFKDDVFKLLDKFSWIELENDFEGKPSYSCLISENRIESKLLKYVLEKCDIL
ncbi:MAG: hypothetical protein ACFFCE_15665 [Promethearchaeota archaeon]